MKTKRWTLMCLVAAILLPSAAVAQESRVYAGGALSLFTQTHRDNQDLGGTKGAASLQFGVWLSPRLAVEIEPTFGPTVSVQFSYRPAISLVADEVASRRDTYWAFNARLRVARLEPVFGTAFVHGHIERHATLRGDGRYFDDEGADDGIAIQMGIDAPFHIAPHVSLFPAFRLLMTSRAETPLRLETRTGGLAMRYGIGARVTF